MTRFWDLLEQSVLVQGLVTVALVFAVIYMAVTSREIPEGLFGMALLALGYYFGSKTQLTGKQAAQEVIKQLQAAKEE